MKPSSPMLPALYPHLLLLFTLNLLWFEKHIAASVLGNETDHLALVMFKDSISNDPRKILASWNSSSHFCNWFGITCSHRHQRVTELSLRGYDLSGPISPHVGNLSFLRTLLLYNNSFYGQIPPELGRLFRLQVLYLNYNMLEGEFPINLASCSKLMQLGLHGNGLTGQIPFEIGILGKLQKLDIGSNDLTGQIPPSIGNLSSLIILSVVENKLEGNIPEELSRLKNIQELGVVANKLSGTLPSFLYNITSLTVFSATQNQYYGSLPANMFFTLPNLQELDIGVNEFSGPIPTSIANASVLQVFDISSNHFEGPIPSLEKLQNLWLLNLGSNNLGANSTKGLEFLKSLMNCSALQILDFNRNGFGGPMPNYVGNLSTQLQRLYLGGNQISGKIPAELGNLDRLVLLAMEKNNFEETIPATFGKFHKMQLLALSGNKLSGNIPTFIGGNLSLLFQLDLEDNMFEGNIPPSIGNCQNLQYLDLSQNHLSGSLPSEVIGLSSLTSLMNLSQNSLSGTLPTEVGRLKNIDKLDLSENHLYGDIPVTIGDCMSLEYLYLQGNSFHGIIPSSVASLKGLRHLDLSRNNLSGSIPEGLQNTLVLEYLNVSFNVLDGEVPTKGVFQNASALALIPNSMLCGGISELHLPPCLVKVTRHTKHHRLKLIAVIVCVVAFLLILSLILSIYWMRKRNKKPSIDLPSINQLAMVSYKNLHHGTDGFSARNLIGSGSFGSVYKGYLESEDRVVAIKVLNLKKNSAHKSFIAECDALKNVRHRNLVKILTCCSSIDYKREEFKALVFEYMMNGSLERWLHPARENADQPRRALDLNQQLNIITDVAGAFHYLHYECEQAVVHCDLKPSNVLLDDSMVAHVSDFGLARLLSTTVVSAKQTSTVGIKGTIGYAPPEYGMGSELSIQGDIYSFGILVLEMLSGRRPTDELFVDGHNLHNFVKLAIPNNLLQIVDPTILPMELEHAVANREKQIFMHPNVEKCVLSLFTIGLACSVESPKERMDMVEVTRELNQIKKILYF